MSSAIAEGRQVPQRAGQVPFRHVYGMAVGADLVHGLAGPRPVRRRVIEVLFAWSNGCLLDTLGAAPG